MYNIIIGVIFIIGGLSGSLALKGTGSTTALAVVGAFILLFGIIQVFSNRRSAPVTRPQPRRLQGRRPAGLKRPPLRR